MTEECPSCGDPAKGTRCSNCLSRIEQFYNNAIDVHYSESDISDENKSQYLKGATFRQKVNNVCDVLEREAGKEEKVAYGEIMDEVGVHRARIAYVLGAISRIENKGGRPLLSAIAVNSSDGTPSGGFYGLAEGLPNLDEDVSAMSKTEREEWWESEVKAVYKYWA